MARVSAELKGKGLNCWILLKIKGKLNWWVRIETKKMKV